MSFIVMSILFASASVFNFVNNNFDNRYATNYLTPTKLLAISDESSFFHQINDGLQIGYGLHYIYHQEPLDTKITEQMESIENIKKFMIIILLIIHCYRLRGLVKICQLK